MHFYYDKNGTIAMRSEAEIDAPQFKHIELVVTDIQKNQLGKNYISLIKDNQLVLAATPSQANQIRLDTVKTEIEGAKTIDDLKSILIAYLLN